MSSRLVWTLALGATCAATGISSSALACTKLPVVLCDPGSFFPGSGTLPANALQWLWTRPFDPSSSPDGADAGVVQPVLSVDVNGQAMDLPLSDPSSSLLTPEQTPDVGSVLELGYSFRCFGSDAVRVQSTITVGPAAARPTTLGTLEPTVRAGDIIVGDCNETIKAGYVDLSVLLSSDALPYRDALQYSLLVDGKAAGLGSQWIPTTDTEPAPNLVGVLRVFAACSGPVSGTAELALGRHRVQAVGTLMDGSRVMGSEQEVDLRCDVPADAGSADAGSADAGGSGVPTTQDAGRDAAVEPTRPTSDAGVQTPTSKGDDGCALTSGASGSWLALALGLLLARRKRA